ncbi:MAG: iron-sulfur cluster assembly scaffold protein [Candidatus Thermoplasmatota archaeon]|jgi:nitrogen fixation NifU-like protein|nr:iron-sulfur cluster assembly scaffold protein [Candidatus Thermoplasmatota archaeon]MCL5437734.1 iron-sulfur cluster assembly scaffold protein [Candidatus Thermoplasmatota archaeon]
MTDEEINAEIILDHYRNPHNYGRIENPTSEVTEYNPVCGDTVHMEVVERNGIVEKVSFLGRGCSISQGSASMLTDLVTGKPVEDVMKMSSDDYLKILGLDLGPAREKCALLSLNAIHKALKEEGDQ